MSARRRACAATGSRARPACPRSARTGAGRSAPTLSEDPRAAITPNRGRRATISARRAGDRRRRLRAAAAPAPAGCSAISLRASDTFSPVHENPDHVQPVVQHHDVRRRARARAARGPARCATRAGTSRGGPQRVLRAARRARRRLRTASIIVSARARQLALRARARRRRRRRSGARRARTRRRPSPPPARRR